MMASIQCRKTSVNGGFISNIRPGKQHRSQVPLDRVAMSLIKEMYLKTKDFEVRKEYNKVLDKVGKLIKSKRKKKR